MFASFVSEFFCSFILNESSLCSVVFFFVHVFSCLMVMLPLSLRFLRSKFSFYLLNGIDFNWIEAHIKTDIYNDVQHFASYLPIPGPHLNIRKIDDSQSFVLNYSFFCQFNDCRSVGRFFFYLRDFKTAISFLFAKFLLLMFKFQTHSTHSAHVSTFFFSFRKKKIW